MVEKGEAGFKTIFVGESFIEFERGSLQGRPDRIVTCELIYTGVSPGSLHIAYRESVDTQARGGAHALNLTFCRSDHFFFSVLGYRFEVARADNDSISLRANKKLDSQEVEELTSEDR